MRDEEDRRTTFPLAARGWTARSTDTTAMRMSRHTLCTDWMDALYSWTPHDKLEGSSAAQKFLQYTQRTHSNFTPTTPFDAASKRSIHPSQPCPSSSSVSSLPPASHVPEHGAHDALARAAFFALFFHVALSPTLHKRQRRLKLT